jgi:hypothetical protein
MIAKILIEPFDFYQSKSSIDDCRIGEISADKSAIIGKDGWCFIYEGSNNYRNSYFDYTNLKVGDEWVELIKNRRLLCENLGIPFIQLIVPNKATLIPEKFPDKLGYGISVILQRLLSNIPDPSLLCPILDLKEPNIKFNVYRKNDSHLTILGNVIIADLILNKLNLNFQINSELILNTVSHIGDLGSKFQNKIEEFFLAPNFQNGFLAQAFINKTNETLVDGLVGTAQSFVNNNFFINKSVLVFGNSFFERCPSWGISPIFASLFRNYHFIWSSDVDESQIKLLNPDIVIAQTCERFLNKLPMR